MKMFNRLSDRLIGVKVILYHLYRVKNCCVIATAERVTAAAVLIVFLLAVLFTEWGMEELTRLVGRRLFGAALGLGLQGLAHGLVLQPLRLDPLELLDLGQRLFEGVEHQALDLLRLRAGIGHQHLAEAVGKEGVLLAIHRRPGRQAQERQQAEEAAASEE